MPISKSAKKSLRAAQAKALRNNSVRRQLDSALKKTTLAKVADIVSVIDKSASKGVISANKASRLKSRLMARLGAVKATKKSTAKPTQTAVKKTKKVSSKKATKSKPAKK